MSTTQALDSGRQGAGSNRLLGAVGVAVVGLVVLGVAAVLVLGRSGPPTYPAGSPEAAFQAYLQASDAGDLETAYAALSPRAREHWTYDAYVREHDAWGMAPDDRRVFIDRTERADDRATLHLTIEWSGGGGLTASRWYERDVRIRMVLVDGTWYIDQDLIGTQETYH